MLIPNSLMRAISEYASTLTCFYVYCTPEECDEIAGFLKKEFDQEWNKALDEAEKVYGECDQKESGYNPLKSIRTTENGIELLFGNLAVYYEDELRALRPNGEDALDKVILSLNERYPEIRYDGYIGYSWADEEGGENVQREITSEQSEELSKKVYPSVGEAIQRTVKIGADFLQTEMSDVIKYYDPEDVEEMLDFLRKYAPMLPEDIKKRLANIVKKCGYKKKMF